MPRIAESHASIMTLPVAALPPVSRVLVAIALTLARWEERRLTRRALSRLDGHMLRDVGLSSQSRDAECLKKAWHD